MSDDPKGSCGTDALPAHRLAMTMLRTTIPSNRAKCPRLCYLDPEEIVDDAFPIDNLKSEYCSHLVVRYFDLDYSDLVVLAPRAKELLTKVDSWREKILEVAPKLILTIGSHASTSTWQMIVANDFRRKELAETIVRMTSETLADGVEVSWTREPMASEFDKSNLKAFIDDLKVADSKGLVEIMVATTAENAFAELYDYEHLNR